MFDRMSAGDTQLMVPPDLELMAPGPELALVLDGLDYELLSEFDLIRVLQAQQRQVSHYQAGSYWTMDRIVTAYQQPGRDELIDLTLAVDGAAAEIGAALVLTRRSAEIETGLAVELRRRLPSVWLALVLGRIDLRRVRVVIDTTLHLPVASARDIADIVLDDARILTTGQLKARIHKLCVDLNPADAKDRYDASLEDRRLIVEANDSGTANLSGLDLPPHVVVSIRRRIHNEAIRLRSQGDTRTMDQLRADIFLDLLRRRRTNSRQEKNRRDGVVDIQVDLTTLAQMNDNSGDLGGYGPVGADIARQIADRQHQSEWRWTLRDPDTGQPIDGGITRRRPTTAQRRKAQALHTTCIHPGCRMSAVDCDIDHRITWADRKLTCTGDLAPLCRHHHTKRHTYGWTYQPIPGGDFLFTTPLRHRYTSSGRPP